MNKQQECQKVIACLKQNISDLANENELNEKSIKDLASKVYFYTEENKII